MTERTSISDAEIFCLLEKAQQEYERHLVINDSSVRLLSQLEVQCAPEFSPDSPIGLVIYETPNGILG